MNGNITYLYKMGCLDNYTNRNMFRSKSNRLYLLRYISKDISLHINGSIMLIINVDIFNYQETLSLKGGQLMFSYSKNLEALNVLPLSSRSSSCPFLPASSSSLFSDRPSLSYPATLTVSSNDSYITAIPLPFSLYRKDQYRTTSPFARGGGRPLRSGSLLMADRLTDPELVVDCISLFSDRPSPLYPAYAPPPLSSTCRFKGGEGNE